MNKTIKELKIELRQMKDNKERLINEMIELGYTKEIARVRWANVCAGLRFRIQKGGVMNA